jgi:hypothetical protein
MPTKLLFVHDADLIFFQIPEKYRAPRTFSRGAVRGKLLDNGSACFHTPEWTRNLFASLGAAEYLTCTGMALSLR